MSQPIRIGCCIYCGTTKTKLTKEHIIPYGFGNTNGDILHDASCMECSTIISKFEQFVLKKMFYDTRIVFQLKSRHTKLPKFIKQYVLKNDKWIMIDVPYKKYKSQIGMPIFDEPGIMRYDSFNSECKILAMQNINLGNSDRDDWYYDNDISFYKALAFPGSIDHSFEKFIMKIAYCASVKIEGYDCVKNSPIPKVLLGYDNRFAPWLGNTGHDYFKQPAKDNSWARYRVDKVSNGIVASVQLFAAIHSSPIYNVIILEI